MISRYNNVSKHKIALIDHIKGLQAVNIQLEKSQKHSDKIQLYRLQKTHITKINSLIPYLNSIGKLSNKEAKSLLSLDLTSVKKLKIKYRIGDGEAY